MTSCGSSSTATPTGGSSVDNSYGLTFNPSTVSWLAANQNGSGSPARGGTLKIVGNSDVDHLDTSSTYTGWGNILMRAISRQLYAYPATTDITTSYGAVPDVAAAMPTVSSDGKTYTIKLRTDVMWNTSPARAVTAQDFVFGLKRLCNPVAPAGAPSYYTSTIIGFADYCSGFNGVSGDLPSIQAYLAGHNISGITTPDAQTIVFTLLQPSSDFVNILTVPFSSAAPKEYNNYLPDSADLHSNFISDGPYTIAKYTPTQEIDLDRNPAWTQASDTIRHDYVDHVQVTLGQTEQSVQQQLEANTADMEWDTTVPTASLPGLLQPSRDPRLGTFPSPDMNPYEVFNLQSKAGSGALANVKVRQALEYAIDKVAIDKIFGGSAVGSVLNQVIPPSGLGHQDLNLYPTPGDRGDPAKCKSLLTAAGVTNLSLKDVYIDGGKTAGVFQEVQKDFGACGVTVTGTPVSASDFFGNYLGSKTASQSGAWDIAEPAWYPDWHGNNGRSSVVPIFDGRQYANGSSDYGDYNSDAVNKLIDQALAATDPTQAANYWHQADQQIMQDAAVIPMRTENVPIFHSSRVHNAIFEFQSLQYDVTQIWLSS